MSVIAQIVSEKNVKLKLNSLPSFLFRKEIYFILKIYFTNPLWDKKYIN